MPRLRRCFTDREDIMKKIFKTPEIRISMFNGEKITTVSTEAAEKQAIEKIKKIETERSIQAAVSILKWSDY